jgi:hypothetical protein
MLPFTAGGESAKQAPRRGHATGLGLASLSLCLSRDNRNTLCYCVHLLDFCCIALALALTLTLAPAIGCLPALYCSPKSRIGLLLFCSVDKVRVYSPYSLLSLALSSFVQLASKHSLLPVLATQLSTHNHETTRPSPYKTLLYKYTETSLYTRNHLHIPKTPSQWLPTKQPSLRTWAAGPTDALPLPLLNQNETARDMLL